MVQLFVRFVSLLLLCSFFIVSHWPKSSQMIAHAENRQQRVRKFSQRPDVRRGSILILTCFLVMFALLQVKEQNRNTRVICFALFAVKHLRLMVEISCVVYTHSVLTAWLGKVAFFMHSLLAAFSWNHFLWWCIIHFLRGHVKLFLLCVAINYERMSSIRLQFFL